VTPHVRSVSVSLPVSGASNMGRQCPDVKRVYGQVVHTHGDRTNILCLVNAPDADVRVVQQCLVMVLAWQ
jgi:hypothetical protein